MTWDVALMLLLLLVLYYNKPACIAMPVMYTLALVLSTLGVATLTGWQWFMNAAILLFTVACIVNTERHTRNNCWYWVLNFRR